MARLRSEGHSLRSHLLYRVLEDEGRAHPGQQSKGQKGQEGQHHQGLVPGESPFPEKCTIYVLMCMLIGLSKRRAPQNLECVQSKSPCRWPHPCSVCVSDPLGFLDDPQPDDHLIFALIAGLVAGVPASGFTVPADVIKTRMQSTGLGLHQGTVPRMR